MEEKTPMLDIFLFTINFIYCLGTCTLVYLHIHNYFTYIQQKGNSILH